MVSVRAFLAATVLCAASSGVVASPVVESDGETEARFSPARFSPAGRDAVLDAPLSLRDGKGPIAIRCAAQIFDNGNSGDLFCYPEAERRLLVRNLGRRIVRVLEGKPFVPARVDDQPVWAWFNFSVVIFEADGETHIRLLPHHGANVEHLGTADYVGAQRYTFPQWSCGRASRISRSSVVMGAAIIDREGRPRGVNVTAAQVRPRCVDRIEGVLEQSAYIPVHLDGEPVDGYYLEAFYGL